MAVNRQHDDVIVIAQHFGMAGQYYGAQIADKDRTYFFRGDIQKLEDWLERNGYRWSQAHEEFVWSDTGYMGLSVYIRPRKPEQVARRRVPAPAHRPCATLLIRRARRSGGE